MTRELPIFFRELMTTRNYFGMELMKIRSDIENAGAIAT